MAAIPSTRQFVLPPQDPAHTTQPPARAPLASTADVVARFMVFLAIGLMVGAALGYMLFPIEWNALLPKDTTQSRQYIAAVADNYWRSLDAVQAQNQLRSLDPDELTQLMGEILRETKNAETRTHIAALAQALDLNPDASPVAGIVSHPLILFAVLASLLPMAAGLWLVVLPAVRERRLEQERIERELRGEGPENTAELRGNAQGLPGEEAAGEGQPGTAADAAQAQAQAQAQGQAEPMTLPPLQQTQPEETEEEAEEHAAEEAGILKDLANLFEEEDVSLSALEAMVKNLPEIDIDEMLRRVHDIAVQLRDMVTGKAKRI